jgi:hypothetical protein
MPWAHTSVSGAAYNNQCQILKMLQHCWVSENWASLLNPRSWNLSWNILWIDDRQQTPGQNPSILLVEKKFISHILNKVTLYLKNIPLFIKLFRHFYLLTICEIFPSRRKVTKQYYFRKRKKIQQHTAFAFWHLGLYQFCLKKGTGRQNIHHYDSVV